MSVSSRELWTILHGLIFGSLFLLAFAGGLAGLYSFRPEWVTVAGIRERLQRLLAGTWLMAVVAWITVLSGTYVVYPCIGREPLTARDRCSWPIQQPSSGTTSAWSGKSM